MRLADLSREGAALGRDVGGGEALVVVALLEGREAGAPALVAAVAVDRLVHRDARRARARPPSRESQRARVLEGLHEGLLHHVERVLGIAQVAEGDAVDAPVVAPHEGLEGLAVARGQAGHEDAILGTSSSTPLA